MKKKLQDPVSGFIFPDASKILFKMKLTLILFLISVFGAIASESYSQTAKLSLDLKNATVKDVLGTIENQSEFYFLYSEKIVDVNRTVNINAHESSVEKVLDKIFEGTNVKYTILDRQIILTTPASKISSGTVGEGKLQKSVSGKVSDASGAPIPGVSVVVKGTTIGVVTDINGNYSITRLPDNAILQFSFIGMRSQEVVVGDKTVINVTLEQEAIGLDEFVTVGYGTQKKRNVIGSVATIRNKELINPVVTDFNSMLQGKASGVYVAQGSIRIRGMNSISSSTEPLYVIDGIVMANAAGLINPNDIESIDVQKDAAATAIYGSRASNGVILITTKSGKVGKSTFTVNASTGFSQFVNDGYKRADADTQLAAMDLSIQNARTYDPTILDRLYDPKEAFSYGLKFQTDENGKPRNFDYFTRDYVKGINTDLAKEVSTNATFNEVNLSTNKSFDKGAVFFSALVRHETTNLKGNDSRKIIARFGSNFSPIKNFKLGFNSTISYIENQSGISGVTDTWQPFMPLNDTTNQTGLWVPAANPMTRESQLYSDNHQSYLRSISNLTGEYSIPFVEGLSIKALAGYDYIAGKTVNWSSLFMNDGLNAMPVSRANESQNSSTILMGNIGLNYDRTFGDHNVTAILYQEAQKSTSYSSYLDAENLSTTFHQIGSSPGTLIDLGSGLSGDFRLLSTLGRVGYKYKSRYMIEASLRRDATSKFSPEKQNATFGAVGAGWILSDESFIKNSISFISLLKIRGSFGQSGNGDMPSFKYMNAYYTSKSYMNLQYTKMKNIGNSTITWETSNNTDIGIDFGLLKNKINGSIAFYNKNVNGLLLEVPLPMSAGVPGENFSLTNNTVWQNVGAMRNRGVEISLSYSPIRTSDFSWDISLNFSTNKNEILALQPNVDAKGWGIESVNTPTITRTGGKLATFYLPEFAGIDPEKGIPMIYERDAEIYSTTGLTVRTGNLIPFNSVTGAANKFIQDGKSSMPDWYGGFNNDFRYKNFDMNIMISYSGNSYFINQAAINSRNVSFGYLRLADDIISNSWKNPGDIAKYPELIYGGGFYYDSEGNPTSKPVSGYSGPSTQDLTRNDYIRIRFITLGYTLPSSVVNKIKLSGIRVYGTVNNAFTFSKAPAEINPELGIPGNLDGNVVYYGLPPKRYYSFGASINF